MTVTDTDHSTDSPATSPRRPLGAVLDEILNIPAGTADADGPALLADKARPLIAALLADLDQLGVTVPAAAIRAVALDDELRDRVRPPAAIGDWIRRMDLTTTSADTLLDLMDDHLRQVQLASGSVIQARPAHIEDVHLRSGELAGQVAAALLQRAVDVLGEALDDITTQLRPRWDTAAKIIAAAVAAGLGHNVTAEQILSSGDLTKLARHWRAIPDAVAVLDRIEAVMLRAILLTGWPLAPGEKARRDRGTWLELSTAGPIPILGPSQRPNPDQPSSNGRGLRSGTAEQIGSELGREALAAYKADAALAAADQYRQRWGAAAPLSDVQAYVNSRVPGAPLLADLEQSA